MPSPQQFAGAATPREAVEGVVAWIHEQHGVRDGLDHGHDDRAGGVAGAPRRLPGLRPPRARARALASASRRGTCPGYLHPSDEDAPIGEVDRGGEPRVVRGLARGVDALDPTNGAPVGPRHVVVAHGRDYGDVPPLKGVFHGGPAGDLEVKVELTRLA